MSSTPRTNKTPATTLTVITAVAPHLAQHLDDCARSVSELRQELNTIGWSVQWVLGVDGPGLDQIEGPDVFFAAQRPSGVATMRNYALGFAAGSWVYSLDGDDMVNPRGMREVLLDPALHEVSFVIGNLTYVGSLPPVRHFAPEKRLPRGTLVDTKRFPGEYNGNNMMARTELLLRAGGWPGLRVDEDGSLLLRMNELEDGMISSCILLRRRRWEGQTTATPLVTDYLLSGQFEHRVHTTRRYAMGLRTPPPQLRSLTEFGTNLPVAGWPDRGSFREPLEGLPTRSIETLVEFRSRLWSIASVKDDHISNVIEQTNAPYEAHLLEVTCALLHPGDLVVDVGANIGNHAIAWALATKARVIAVEVNPHALEYLRRNIVVNNLVDRIHVEPVALGSAEGRVALVETVPTNLGATKFRPDHDGHFTMKQLDDILAENVAHVRLLKIDVEGMEPLVLAGAVATLRQSKPLVVAEAHTTTDIERINAILTPYGYVRHPESLAGAPTYLWEPTEH